MISISHDLSLGGFILKYVGKPAPPIPIIPAFFNISRNEPVSLAGSI